MANETKHRQKQAEEEKKLVAFYGQVAGNEKEYTPQQRFFMQLLNTKIAQVDNKERRSRNFFRSLGMTGLIVSAVTTVILGLKLAASSWVAGLQTNTALIASALTTTLVGLANLYDADNYFFRVKAMLNKLKLLRYSYVFALMDKENNPVDEEEMGHFQRHFNGIVGDGYWEDQAKKQPKSSPDSHQPEDRLLYRRHRFRYRPGRYYAHRGWPNGCLRRE